ncbi:ABC transporter ATP-binding protein [Wenzhouxiangella sp. XN24]|uniref:energy-coupling factor ABC transporter ATP-binding protein n=1 Tax=Wenzhouxiangella sp. XN24 TaxID=2713569 RepID=UPI0013ED747F|nr:ABC transporter ATP-binding protein [Wenzhouxiangella sp. XN24]NGX16885.1 ABC transporter ATP-binding protein [Wenzhouxiangella sp. XN24]
MTEPLFSLEKVSVDYPGSGKALEGLDLEIAPGERVVLLGTNGCGKTTLLKLLDGLVAPSGGILRFAGEPLDSARLARPEFARDFRRRVALMFQHPEAMLFNPTVAAEIGFGLRHLPEADARERVRHWADVMRLDMRLDAPPSQLSGGEKQRLCLACLLAIEPEVLLLDEPTANLDPRTVGWLIDWLAERDITTVVATHHMALAPELGARAVILAENHTLAFDGPVSDALADLDLLLENNLAHRHRHHHDGVEHEHVHGHPVWGPARGFDVE